MKTVMKKMFCLLLVAVMLVGVMPFAAFADTYSGTTDVQYPDRTSAGEGSFSYVPGQTSVTIDMALGGFDMPLGYAADYLALSDGTKVDAGAYTPTTATASFIVVLKAVCKGTADCTTEPHDPNCQSLKCNIDGCQLPKSHDGKHTWQCTKTAGCESFNGHEGKCTDQIDCPNCGDVIIANDPDHICCTTCHKSGHLYTACPDVIRPCCKVAATEPHAATCYTRCSGERDCKNVNHDPAKNCKHALCDVPGCTELETVQHTVHPGADCEVSGCTKDKGHTGDHSNVCAICKLPLIKSPEHNENCDYYYLNAEPSNTGNALVRIHVRLHNGDTLIDTVELLSYRDDKGTQIGDSVSAHKSMIRAELAEKYPEYSWGGNLYDDPGDSQDYNEQIGTGTTVYINAYAGQDMVLIYVHNSRSFNNLRIIQLQGKRRGDTVTKKDVTDAVSKYYNVSSLAMYSEDAWEDYVDGENVESVSSLKIPKDDAYYVIDVKISGTAKSGSSGSSYTADSSNPKTGDAIFAPVAVLGLSASALAVLFFLNKKRAY